MKNRGLLTILFTLLFSLQSLAQAELAEGYHYLFPGPGARYVHPASTLIIRFERISPGELANLETFIRISGEQSGTHPGKTTIASDKRTLIFEPDKRFKPGEKVNVTMEPKFSGYTVNPVDPINFEFLVLEKEVETKNKAAEDIANHPGLKNTSISKPGIMSNGVSVPSDFPHVNITPNYNPSSDYVFVNTTIAPYYQIIINTQGDPVWYRKTPDIREDFRVQSNGWITMQEREGYTEPDLGHSAFTQNFEYIKTFQATNGYSTDEHEFFMLPDSGYFLIGKRDTEVDMSQYVSGGMIDAIVVETCIQEFTADDQLIFIWRAWDHFDIRDVEHENLTGPRIRFPHMNAIFTDDDGHILLSSRHLSEISKIHRQTGEFIWRMSGNPDSKNNDFQFVNDPLNGFRNQHAIRSLGNNRYTLLDNGNLHVPPVSRAVEYVLDTVQWTATLIWAYIHDEDHRIARFMGNTQRLSNGNTHINWALGQYPTIALEVTPDGMIAFEMHFENGSNCYRSFRHPWEGKCPAPYLLLDPQIDTLTLIMNKFGDNQVDHYKIYGGTSPHPTSVIDTSRTPLKHLAGLEKGVHYYFRVTAIDKNGSESGYSNEEDIVIRDTEPGSNLLINGDFSYGLDSWVWEVDSTASAEVQADDSVCSFVIQKGGEHLRDVQLWQNDILLIMGQSYVFEFDAWAEKTRIVEIGVGEDQSPFTDYSRLGYTALHSEPNRYRYTFEMKEATDLNSRVLIYAGTSAEDIHMDNISLKLEVPSKTDDKPQAAGRFLLYPNYPNPFSSVTWIEYDLPERSFVKLTIYNSTGQKVKDYINAEQTSGRHSREIRLRDYSSGVYFYSLKAIAVHTANLYQKTNRMILLK